MFLFTVVCVTICVLEDSPLFVDGNLTRMVVIGVCIFVWTMQTTWCSKLSIFDDSPKQPTEKLRSCDCGRLSNSITESVRRGVSCVCVCKSYVRRRSYNTLSLTCDGTSQTYGENFLGLGLSISTFLQLLTHTLPHQISVYSIFLLSPVTSVARCAQGRNKVRCTPSCSRFKVSSQNGYSLYSCGSTR